MSYDEGRRTVQLREDSSPGQWTVKPGDTLWDIAQATMGDGSQWQKLWQTNKSLISNPDELQPGIVLTIPSESPTTGAATSSAPACQSSYTVKPGDSLVTIARDELGDESLWQTIWAANKDSIPFANMLSVGQRLVLPGSPTAAHTVPFTAGSPFDWFLFPGVCVDSGTAPEAQPAEDTPEPEYPEPLINPDGIGRGMAPDGPRAVGTSGLQRTMANMYNTKGRFVKEKADGLGIEAAVAASCLAIESGGSGHVGGKLTIRFEEGWFQGLTGQHVPTLHSGLQEDEYTAFESALAIDENAAYESISMGAAQIMGFNATRVGYGSAKDMFDTFSRSTRAQLTGFFEFVNTDRALLRAAKNKDWPTFALLYNGEGYEINAYDTKLAGAYDAYKQVTRGLPYA
jgi:LysM repeat protein